MYAAPLSPAGWAERAQALAHSSARARSVHVHQATVKPVLNKDMPSNADLIAVWGREVRRDQAWHCQHPDCDQVSLTGAEAAYHAMLSGHGLPKLGARPRPPDPPLPGVRIGDAMRLHDSCSLALEIAEAAIAVAARAHAPAAELNALSRLVAGMRRGS